jgi:hypothetical protein
LSMLQRKHFVSQSLSYMVYHENYVKRCVTPS